MREDLELKQFRELMPAPDHWDEGFGVKAMLGGLFVGMIMTPASMYMNLVVGGGIGSAAQWVTIILFMEVSRRAFAQLKRPEIYVLYYMAGASLISATPLIQNQFLVQSETFRQFNLADKVPTWVAPHDPDILGRRSFFQAAWLAPIGLLILGQVMARIDHFGLGYVMYRLTSDVEKLPFPMAPVGALGITALADASDGSQTWRWRVFSFGAMLGMAFAAIYIALPSITGAVLSAPISILPLPFKDLTANAQHFLPAVPILVSLDLGVLLSGMILPFWAMVGSFIGLILIMIGNPILYRYGILHTWRPGVGALTTLNANLLDFYMSFGFGLTLAIAVIGILHVFRTSAAARRESGLDAGSAAPRAGRWDALFRPPPGRGDFSLFIAMGLYVFSTVVTIVTACWLLHAAHLANPANSEVGKLLIGVLLFYGFLYTPLISYVSARMEGIVGMSVNVPYVREATFILSGYRGAAIWFAPFPAYNYGAQTSYFRQTELTGTKITSMIKAEAFILPVVIISTLLFSQFLWRMAPIPSAAFPYAQQVWEANAYRTAVIDSSTLPGNAHGPFAEAFKPWIMGGGLAFALTAYAIMSFLGLPVLMVYGLIRGLDGSTTGEWIIPQFLGALLGRFYCAKKFGQMWPQYRVVFFAGYTCGVGLIAMFSLGIIFVAKSVVQTQY